MTQRTEKEETEYKVVPDNIFICVTCGVSGNSATNKLCPNCFNATSTVSTTAAASAAGGKLINHVFVEKSLRSISSTRSSPERIFFLEETSRDLKKKVPKASESEVPAKREVSRCSGYRRKVGLTGFRCRCGELFCADHRYSDRHDCSYDYKSSGREAIARDNPVVKAAKIIKIRQKNLLN
ncbi:switch-activating protein Sap1 [Orobanche gracilis]